MLYLLIIKEEAHVDIGNAYKYYEGKQIGLGEKFLQALVKRFNDLSQHPTHYSFIEENAKRIFRDVKLEKFPYVIVYEISNEEVIVYAVFNVHQNPAKKFEKRG